jgi:hypothetical protein
MTWLLWLSIGALVAAVFARIMVTDSAYKEMSARFSRDTPFSGRAIFSVATFWAVLLWPLAFIAVVVMLARARKQRSN